MLNKNLRVIKIIGHEKTGWYLTFQHDGMKEEDWAVEDGELKELYKQLKKMYEPK